MPQNPPRGPTGVYSIDLTDDLVATTTTPQTITGVKSAADFRFNGNPWIDPTNAVINAKGDGVTDDTTPILAAVAAIPAATGGIVRGPAGANFLMSQPIKVYRLTDTVPSIAPSIMGVGSGADKFAGTQAATKFTASGTFPTGEFMIDYLGTQTTGFAALSGYRIEHFAIECTGRAAGIRQCNGMSWRIEDIVCNLSAIPAPANTTGTPTGAMAMVAQASNDYSYNNVLDHVYVIGAAKDGFQLTQGGGSWVVAQNCSAISGNATRYNYIVGDATVCSNCDAQSGVTADYYLQGGVLMNCTEYFATHGNSIIVDNPFGNSIRQSQIIGGQFRGTSQGALSEANAALVHVVGFPMHLNVIGADFIAGTTTSDWLYLDAAVTGTITYVGCDFNPSPGPITHPFNLNGATAITQFWDCPGINPFVVTTPAVSTPLTNNFGVNIFVSFIANAAGTTFTVNTKALGATPANAQSGFFWPTGTVMSYVGAPASWAFIGL